MVAPNALRHPAAPPLPATTDDLIPLRHLKHKRNLNDLIEDLLIAVWDEADFQRYVHATYDEQAVEGSLAIDNGKAAEILRDKAKAIDSEVKDEKLATIVKSMNVVLKRYHQSRKERRMTVRGEVVPNDQTGE